MRFSLAFGSPRGHSLTSSELSRGCSVAAPSLPSHHLPLRPHTGYLASAPQVLTLLPRFRSRLSQVLRLLLPALPCPHALSLTPAPCSWDPQAWTLAAGSSGCRDAAFLPHLCGREGDRPGASGLHLSGRWTYDGLPEARTWLPEISPSFCPPPAALPPTTSSSAHSPLLLLSLPPTVLQFSFLLLCFLAGPCPTPSLAAWSLSSPRYHWGGGQDLRSPLGDMGLEG